jgi:hypothetical protein
MAFSYIYYIIRNICFNYEDRVLVATDVETFALTDCIELGAVMFSNDLSVWILLVTGLLDVLTTASICFSLELNVVFNWLCKLVELIV